MEGHLDWKYETIQAYQGKGSPFIDALLRVGDAWHRNVDQSDTHWLNLPTTQVPYKMILHGKIFCECLSCRQVP